MVKKEIKCTSCKIKVTNIRGTVTFKCPGCLKVDLVRCPDCRKRAIKYKCSCGFTGPN